MKSKNMLFLFSLVMILFVPLHAKDNGSQRVLPKLKNERGRAFLMGPVMAFGVATAGAYCAGKVNMASSPLAMISCFAIYHMLYKAVSRRREHYNRWQVIPAMVLGYGFGYYKGICAQGTIVENNENNNVMTFGIEVVEADGSTIRLEEAVPDDALTDEQKKVRKHITQDFLRLLSVRRGHVGDHKAAFDERTGLGIREVPLFENHQKESEMNDLD